MGYPVKTQAGIIDSSRLFPRMNLAFGRCILRRSFNIYHLLIWNKNQGVTLDSILSRSPHLFVSSRKTYAAMGTLRCLQHIIISFAIKFAVAQIFLQVSTYLNHDYTNIIHIVLLENQLNSKYMPLSSVNKAFLLSIAVQMASFLHILQFLYIITFNPAFPRYIKERFS